MDYDGDGRLDLVTGSDDCCNRDREFFVFRRRADGRLGPRETIRLRDEEGIISPFTPRIRVGLADWNRDGRLDVIVENASRLLLVPGPLADGAELPIAGRIESAGPLRGMTTRPNVVDWDGDGLLDVVVGLGRGQEVTPGVYLFRGLGGGTGVQLAAPQRLIAAPDGASVYGLDVADWDGDGVEDIIVGLSWRTTSSESVRARDRSQVWVYRRQAGP